MTDALAKRKVTVRRLFILTEKEMMDKAVLQRMKTDSAAGVQVRSLLATDWQHTSEDINFSPVDFGIWDGTTVWVYTPKQGARRPAFISINRAEVQRYKSIFEANWIHGKPLS